MYSFIVLYYSNSSENDFSVICLLIQNKKRTIIGLAFNRLASIFKYMYHRLWHFAT